MKRAKQSVNIGALLAALEWLEGDEQQVDVAKRFGLSQPMLSRSVKRLREAVFRDFKPAFKR